MARIVMKAKAVLFDLGGTMIDSAEFHETFRRILEIWGIRRSSRDVKKAMLKAEDGVKKKYGNEVPRDTDYYAQWNLKILHILNIYEHDKELADVIDKDWFDYMEIRPRDGLADVLRALKDGGVKLGIVTNGYQTDLEKILPKLHLGEIFDILVAADTIGKKKPNPDIFLYAVRRLRVEPSETVYVGDEYENDYLGAKKAGLFPVLFQARGRKSMRSSPPDINVIHSLPELLTKIRICPE
jgi:putative hydrolase of the HAD superfamily